MLDPMSDGGAPERSLGDDEGRIQIRCSTTLLPVDDPEGRLLRVTVSGLSRDYPELPSLEVQPLAPPHLAAGRIEVRASREADPYDVSCAVAVFCAALGAGHVKAIRDQENDDEPL
ncbi:MAG: hypothetical protein AAGD01_15080 [Acidobacteriota bacterium]